MSKALYTITPDDEGGLTLACTDSALEMHAAPGDEHPGFCRIATKAKGRFSPNIVWATYDEVVALCALCEALLDDNQQARLDTRFLGHTLCHLPNVSVASTSTGFVASGFQEVGTPECFVLDITAQLEVGKIRFWVKPHELARLSAFYRAVAETMQNTAEEEYFMGKLKLGVKTTCTS